MSEKWTKQTVILTGGASGIGKGIAEAFLREGCSVLLVDVQEEALSRTTKEFQERYGVHQVQPFVADIRQTTNAKKIVAHAQELFQRVDVLVNCAGIYPSTFALEITEEQWNQVYDLNVKAPFFLAQAAAEVMKNQNNGGRIVNIASTASEVARPGVAHYCSSKAAVKMLTQVLALEWSAFGIRVNAVAPGLVETETLLRTLITEEAQKEHLEKLSYCPMNRPADVQEIADAVLYLAGNGSSYVTGQTLFVDGGYSAGRVFQTKTQEVSHHE